MAGTSNDPVCLSSDSEEEKGSVVGASSAASKRAAPPSGVGGSSGAPCSESLMPPVLGKRSAADLSKYSAMATALRTGTPKKRAPAKRRRPWIGRNTIFIDPKRGSSDGNGTEEHPVPSLELALDLLRERGPSDDGKALVQFECTRSCKMARCGATGCPKTMCVEHGMNGAGFFGDELQPGHDGDIYFNVRRCNHDESDEKTSCPVTYCDIHQEELVVCVNCDLDETSVKELAGADGPPGDFKQGYCPAHRQKCLGEDDGENGMESCDAFLCESCGHSCARCDGRESNYLDCY